MSGHGAVLSGVKISQEPADLHGRLPRQAAVAVTQVISSWVKTHAFYKATAGTTDRINYAGQIRNSEHRLQKT